MSGRIGYEKRGNVAWIRIDRPEAKNAFIGTMREELAFSLDRAHNDPSVRAAVLAGGGGVFTTGGDLDYLSGLAEREDFEGLRKLLDGGAQIVRTIRKIEKPVIAAVDGLASGAGCSLAAACDLLFASQRATFSLSFVRIGFVPDWGGTFFLPRRMGAARTFRMGSTGETIDASTALAWGLADRLFPVEGFEEAVEREAERFAALSATSLSFQKYLIGSEEIPALEDALARENEAQLACFETEEFRRAMAERRNG
jgi:2-(1,2-epoxy-1,2-dihydrophenyl)acetyl-CoA isomerase